VTCNEFIIINKQHNGKTQHSLVLKHGSTAWVDMVKHTHM